MLKKFVIFLFSCIVFIGLSGAVLDAIYGGGDPFEDRTGEPTLSSEALIRVADLEWPPGNISVTENERIFFTFHPEARPPYNVAELVDGKAQPFPTKMPDDVEFKTVLSLRVDRQNRLWTLDNTDHGQEPPRLLAFDINSEELVHRYDFPSEIAGLGSHLNDFQISADGRFIFIADASIFGKNPALVVYDVEKQEARRLLDDHESVEPDNYVPVVQGIKMLMFGVFAIRPGVDSIALDRKGEWLYYAPVTDDHMHRVKVSDLLDKNLPEEELEKRVQRFGIKTMSDGITMDDQGRIYISDLEHSAIIRMHPDATLETYYKDDKLRWPDGFSFGPDGWLYVTASSLQHVILKPHSYIQQKGPYQIFKLKTDGTGFPGH